MLEQTPNTLILTIRPNTISRFTTFLQRGFLIPCNAPITLYDLLLTLPGFDRQYISSHIETIFINGTASDSFRQYLVPGNTVALSAAMPGLAGAIFRKNGPHASLRSTPVSTQHNTQTESKGFITIKLFNMIAGDKGEDILTAGILVKGSTLARFFHSQQKRLQPLLVDIRKNSMSLSPEDATLFAESHSRLQLKVISL
jgi:hypothetical protein